jgi:hypothetical protein
MSTIRNPTIFDGHSSGLAVDSFRVPGPHTVRLDVHGGPPHRTRAGRRPITVTWVLFDHHVTPDHTAIRSVDVELTGFPAVDSQWAARRGPGPVTRQFVLTDADPEWLHQLASQSTPMLLSASARDWRERVRIRSLMASGLPR